MMIVLIILGICVIILCGFILIGCVEYKQYIKRMSKKYTLNNIEVQMQEYKDLLNRGKLKGFAIDNVLDGIELLEELKEYKDKHKIN